MNVVLVVVEKGENAEERQARAEWARTVLRAHEILATPRRRPFAELTMVTTSYPRAWVRKRG
jgi:hypothetical protein